MSVLYTPVICAHLCYLCTHNGTIIMEENDAKMKLTCSLGTEKIHM